MTPSDFGKRLQMLEDIEAIKQLHHEYIYFLNNRQWDDMAELFAEDATAHIYRHPLKNGRQEILKLFTDTMSKVNYGKGRDCHFVVEPVIKVDGDTAKAHWMLYILVSDAETGKAGRWAQGKYDVQYARIDGKWKFKSLIWTNPWPRTPDSLPKFEDTQIP
jgi:ketosteroid isomerase-like protein